MEKIYVGEYSVSQGCGHIETLDEAIKNNRFIILNGRNVDYLVITYNSDYDKVAEELDNFKKELENRKEN